MSGFLLIGLIVVVWLVVLAPLLLRGQKPIRKAGEAFDETRVILEGGSSVPMRRRPRLADEHRDDEVEDLDDDDYEIADSPSIFRHRREDVEDTEDEEQSEPPESTESETVTETDVVAAADSDNRVVMGVEDTLEDSELVVVSGAEATGAVDVTSTSRVEVLDEWNEEDHYPMDDSYNAPIDFMHHEERIRAVAEYQELDRTDGAAASGIVDPEYSDELTEADMEFARSRRGRGYYDPQADREFAQSLYIRRQRTLLGLAVAVLATVILGFVLGGAVWSLPIITIIITGFYLVALRKQVRAENALRARRIRRLRRSRMGVRHSEDFPQRLRRPGAVVLELDDESPDFEGLDTTYLPVEAHEDDHRSHRTRRVS